MNRALHFLCVLCLTSYLNTSWGQDKVLPIHYPPAREFHMINIDLNLKFDLTKKKVFGTAIEKIVPLKNDYDTVHLDAIGMKIEKILMNREKLHYRYDGSTLSIEIKKKYDVNDTLTYTIVYSTIPVNGLFFVFPDSAYPDRPPQIWSHCEPEYARYWIPCHDYPDDFLSSSLTATVPEDWVMVSNGALDKVSTDKKKRTKTYRWIEAKPHVTYLISIVAGKFSILNDQAEGIPLYYYVAPQDTEFAKDNFKHTPDIIRFYSDFIDCKYPWEKLSLSTVSNFLAGGMENVSAITLRDELIQNPLNEPFNDMKNYVAHEAAHQWFGDLLTCRSWDHIWLNEGFATYLQPVYEDHAFGKDYFVSHMLTRQATVKDALQHERRPMVYTRYLDPNDLFGVYVYQLGAVVLNMLRGVLGDSVFQKAITHYVHKYQFHCVDTHDFESAVEEMSGQNLDWFFDEWAYKAGYPIFNITYTYNDTSHLLTLQVIQTQKVDSLTPVYKMPVDIYVATPAKNYTYRVWVDSLHNTYTFDVPQKPLMVNFDEGNFLLKEMTFKKTQAELAYQLKMDPDIAGRIWAIDQLSVDSTVNAVGFLKERLEHDPSWSVRQRCASALSKYSAENVGDVLMKALNDKEEHVQYAAINSLGTIKDTAAKEILIKVFKERRNTRVRGGTLVALAKIEGKAVLPLIDEGLNMDSRQTIIKMHSLYALREIDSLRTYEVASDFIKYGQSPSLRASTVSSLDRIGITGKKALNFLRKYISDPNPTISVYAINSFGSSGEEKDIPLLEKMENETSGYILSAVRQAITSIKKRCSTK